MTALFEDFKESLVVKDLDLAVNLLTVLTMSLAVNKSIGHQKEADQDSGNDTCQEQIADRGSGGHGIHDEGNTRRNDNSKAARNSHDGCRKDLVISHVDQKRNRHTADRRNGCRRRSRDSSVEEACDNDGAGDSGRAFAEEIGENIKETF